VCRRPDARRLSLARAGSGTTVPGDRVRQAPHPCQAPDPPAHPTPGSLRPVRDPAARGTVDLPPAALGVAIACLLAGYIVGSILGGAAEAAGDSQTGAATIFAGEIGLWGGMFAAAVVVCRRYGTGSLRRDLGYRLGWRDLWPGLGAAAVGLVVAEILGIAFEHTRFAGSNTEIITGQHNHASPSFITVTVIVAVGAPAFEELFFRGVVRASLSRFGSHAAVWGQGGLFGLAHYQPGLGLKNVSVIVIVGALGVVLGYTARATARLGPGILAHGLFNVVQASLAIASS
jgi:membrane protease YdiL (CAAX protease family)